MKFNEYIDMNEQIRFGKPCIKETRISVEDVLGWLASGASIEEIITDYPQLNQKKIQACLQYAAEKERRYQIAG